MDDANVAIEFLARYFADEAAGTTLALADYLRLFPGFEEIVAEEYFRLVGELDDLEPVPETARYVLGETLGEGGMGRVYLAHDRDLDRSVAVKIPRGAVATFESHRSLLYTEARMTARLRHPALPPIHDLGVDSQGRPFYAMRHLEGESLEALLARRRADDAWPLTRLLSIFQQACLAVAFAHSRGVLHLDLKPANIMLGAFGELVVVDWGLAQSDASPDPRMAGTPGYMAPEQIEGQSLSTAADLFALGTILYEIVSEGRAFVGDDTRTILLRTRQGEFNQRCPGFQRASTEIRRLIRDCLELEPGRRPESAGAIHVIVQSHLEGQRDDNARRGEADRSFEGAVDLIAQRDRRRKEVEARAVSLRRERAEPWAPLAKKRDTWHAEDEYDALRREAQSAHRAALERLTTAHAQCPEHEAVRRSLGDLYREEIMNAEQTGNSFAERYYADRLRELDLPEHADFLQEHSTLKVRIVPPIADIVLHRVATSGVLERHTNRQVIQPEISHRLPIGTYRLTLQAEGFAKLRAPIRLRRGSTHEVHLQLRRSNDLAPGFVPIPGGTFVRGGDPAAIGAVERTEVPLDDFAIAKYPVTFREYGLFLRSLEPKVAAQHTPRRDSTSPLLFYDPKRNYRLNRRRGSLEHGRWPVFGVSWHDARAYAEWKMEQDDRRYSLPSGDEWEMAARGADARVFPWGNHFDSALSKTVRSRPGKSQPEAIGSFRADCSPYGVRDLAGGVQEWCNDWHDEIEGKRLVKGGSWAHSEALARAASRTGLAPDSVEAFVGFRLVHHY